ncbi:hypothetical protein Hte_008215 [Hypoxylon texense]
MSEGQRLNMTQMLQSEIQKLPSNFAWLTLVETEGAAQRHQEMALFYCLVTSDGSRYELLDAEQTRIPMLPQYDAIKPLLMTAAHLGRYQYYLNLGNNAYDQHEIEFGRLHRESRKIFDRAIEARDGTKVSIGFKNKSYVPLFISVLCFDSLWGISKVFPQTQDWEEVDWKMGCDFDMIVDFPKESSAPSVVETLKAFVTTKPISFQSLVTRSVLQSRTISSTKQSNAVPGETLPGVLAKLDSPSSNVTRDFGREPNSRPVRPIQVSTDNTWQTKEIQMHIRR